jgi:hypothetical protein
MRSPLIDDRAVIDDHGDAEALVAQIPRQRCIDAVLAVLQHPRLGNLSPVRHGIAIDRYRQCLVYTTANLPSGLLFPQLVAVSGCKADEW